MSEDALTERWNDDLKEGAYTVGDLIRDLSKLPPETPVFVLSDYEPFPVERGLSNLFYDLGRQVLYVNEHHEVRWVNDVVGYRHPEIGKATT